MFEYIKGKIVDKKVDSVALELNNGIAYKIYISLSTYEKIQEEEEKLYIYNYIREDKFKLYGFHSKKERDVFEILVNANGVGAKLAIAVLSTYNIYELKKIIVNEDLDKLKKVPGIGKKKGQRLLIDIKGKIKLDTDEFQNLVDESSEDQKTSQIREDLVLALQSLGYKESAIDKTISKVDISKYDNVELAITEILKKMQG
ncbi:MAG: Holliday junction branch migration protein RuvA [Fusobacteriota bacterium]